MNEREKQEEKNKRIGWITSVSVQLVLLILFYFIVAWKEPFPPIPEYGIELGFTAAAGAPSSAQPAPQNPEVDETPVNEQSEPEETEETESAAEVQETLPPSEVESPDKVEESDEEPTPALEEPKVDSKSLRPPSTSENKSAGSPSESEENELNEQGIHGNQETNEGDQEGPRFEGMSGWKWESEPIVVESSQEFGEIKFNIVVDSNGYLIDIKPASTNTATPLVVSKYRQAVEQLTWIRTSKDNPASISRGTVIFILKPKKEKE